MRCRHYDKKLSNLFPEITANTTVSRTWNLPDLSGNIALTSDITGVNSGTNTGDETASTIKTKLGITTLSGSNTGDQIIPTTLPASDVSAWAKAATKPTYTAAEVGAQETLVSGTNIRTVNGNSLLGSTNLVINGGVTSVNGMTGAVTVNAGLSLAQSHAIALSF